MKVLVCGSRTWSDDAVIRRALSDLPRGSVVIHGGARGADLIAGTVARSLGLSVWEFPADWKNLGRSAGYRRNIEMLDERPDLVIAFWENGSKGTEHTVREALRRGYAVDLYFGT